MAAVEDAQRARDDVTPVNNISNTNALPSLNTSQQPTAASTERRIPESAISEDGDDLAESVFSEDLGGATLERKTTNTEHTSVPKPGDVRINVKGAFIVEEDGEEPGTPEQESMPGGGGGDMESEGYQLERRGIRLPNHKAVVSHIAVDDGIQIGGMMR